MNKVLSNIGHAAEVVGKDVVKVVTYVPLQLVKVEHVIATAIKDQPQVKAAVIELVKQAQVVIADVSTDVAAKGIDLSSDLKTLKDAEAFFPYFRDTFLVTVEAVYKDMTD